jgi:PAS domain S-box-containing protein
MSPLRRNLLGIIPTTAALALVPPLAGLALLDVNSHRLAVAALALLGAAGAAILLWYRIDRRLSDPVQHLAKIVHQAAADKNYALRAERRGGRDLDLLINGVNELLAQSQALDEGLEAARSELERHVQERTAELQRERTKFNEAQQIAHVGSWEWDLGPNRITWSEELHRIFGLEPGGTPLTYEAYLERIHPSERAGVRAAIDHALKDQRPFTREERIVRPDGEIRELFVWGKVVADDEGRPSRMLGVAQDITDVRRAERELAARARDLERSNADLEQFAYVASHDLQEPLRMVASYVQLLSRRYRGKLDKDADEFIAFAVDGATRMQNLIRDLLTYSRVTRLAGPMEIVDTGQALLASLVNLKVAVEESGAHIAYDSLPPVRGDATALIALFQNLVGNAVKFRAGRTPEVRIDAARRADEWIFSVKDNGIGFDPQYAERVFVIFQRLNTRDKYEGTGIGLAICKKIVERHGGRIWVETKPGEGSTFFFSIPGLPADARRTAHPAGRTDMPRP